MFSYIMGIVSHVDVNGVTRDKPGFGPAVLVLALGVAWGAVGTSVFRAAAAADVSALALALALGRGPLYTPRLDCDRGGSALAFVTLPTTVMSLCIPILDWALSANLRSPKPWPDSDFAFVGFRPLVIVRCLPIFPAILTSPEPYSSESSSRESSDEELGAMEAVSALEDAIERVRAVERRGPIACFGGGRG